MSMLLVHELHEARDRILVLKQQLEDARGRELPAYQSFLAEQIDLLDEALNEAKIEADSRLETLRRDLEARNVGFNWKRDPALHDREIRLDNGWIVKIGRGLDIYHIPENWLSIEASDFSLRRCKQTKVDIFRE